MNTKDITEIKKYFNKYSTDVYHSPYYSGQEVCEKYSHKEEDYFQILIFDDSKSVYQTNSDHEIQGIELITIDDLRIRFKSFTGKYLGTKYNDNETKIIIMGDYPCGTITSENHCPECGKKIIYNIN